MSLGRQKLKSLLIPLNLSFQSSWWYSESHLALLSLLFLSVTPAQYFTNLDNFTSIGENFIAMFLYYFKSATVNPMSDLLYAKALIR